MSRNIKYLMEKTEQTYPDCEDNYQEKRWEFLKEAFGDMVVLMKLDEEYEYTIKEK